MGNILSAFNVWISKRSSRGVANAGLTPAGNPLPPVVHQVLEEAALKPGRLVLIGDVHGCHTELQLLLDKLQYDSSLDNLVFVGDLVNKGPLSDKVVETAQQLGALCVRGNHDDAALAAYQQLQRGNPTPKILSKYRYLQGDPSSFVGFLSSLPFSLQIPAYGITVVHAGLIPDLQLLDQSLSDLYKMRDLRRDPATGRWQALERPEEGSQPWAGCWEGPEHIFFGHDAKRRLQDCVYATGLDSGCVYGGDLTACVLPPLNLLRANDVYSGRRAARQPLALQHLQGQLVSVQALQAYEQKGGGNKAAAATAASGGGTAAGSGSSSDESSALG